MDLKSFSKLMPDETPNIPADGCADKNGDRISRVKVDATLLRGRLTGRRFPALRGRATAG
jgi:hypothetical protein